MGNGTSDTSQHGSKISSPWPCARCGHGLEVNPKVGRLPRLAVIMIALLFGTLTLGVFYHGASPMINWALLLLAQVAWLYLIFRQRRRTAWFCRHCQQSCAPRLRHSGPMRLGIVIPTYNNETSIAGVVEGCLKHQPTLPLIVVADGATDGTADEAQHALDKEQHPDTPFRILLRHKKNRGKGAAIQTALRYAAAHHLSHIICLDGDGQHQPSDLTPLMDAARRHPTAIITGSRDLSGTHVENISKWGRSFSNFWLHVQTGIRIRDSQSGFRVYPVLPTLSLGCTCARFDYEVEVLTLAGRVGIPLKDIPISAYYPPPSERVSHFDKCWDNVRISWLNTRLLAMILIWPLGWPAKFSNAPPPTTLKRSWSGQSLGGALGHRIFFWILAAVGPKPAYLLLYFVSAYYFIAQRKAARTTYSFFERIFKQPSTFALWRLSYAQILMFARCILDRGIAQTLGPSAFNFESEGRDHIDKSLQKGRGLILLSAHLGNNALAGTILSSSGQQLACDLHLVMLDAEAQRIRQVYEGIDAVDQMPHTIAINRGTYPSLEILRALRHGDAVAIQGDRVVGSHFVWANFLGTPAPIPTGVFLLAQAAKVPIVLTFAVSLGAGRYRFIAETPREIELPRGNREEALRQHAQWFADRLGHYAKTYPTQWFNFFDFWKKPS